MRDRCRPERESLSERSEFFTFWPTVVARPARRDDQNCADAHAPIQQ